MEPNDGFAWTQADGKPVLVCRPFERAAQHLYTARQWALGIPTAPEADAWAEVARAVGVDGDRLVRVSQVHGAAVHKVQGGDGSGSGRQAQADIIISNDPGLALAIQTADCVPLLIADTRLGAVAAAHAGWRGLAARVPAVAVAALAREFGSTPGDLVAAAGPSISAVRYEVGADVRHRFEEGGFERLDRWFLPGTRTSHWQFDGWQATRDQLAAAGLSRDRVFIAALCTATHPEAFCSYRRDGSSAGRMAAVIRPRGVMISTR